MPSTVIKIESLRKEYRYGVVSSGLLFRDLQSWWARVQGDRGQRTKSDLFSEINDVMQFILKHINKRIVISGRPQHEEIWDYPLEALREAVINAILHRDYRSSSDTVLKIFDDRIELFNPGKLPEGMTISRLKSGDYVSTPRNKQIAAIFKEAGIIEKYGSGIRRIRSAMLDAGNQEPRFEEIGEGFRVTLLKAPPQITPPVTPPVTGEIPENKLLSEKIVMLMQQEPRISLSKIAQRLGIGRETVKEYVERLKRENRLRRIGRTSAGHWEIVQKKRT